MIDSTAAIDQSKTLIKLRLTTLIDALDALEVFQCIASIDRTRRTPSLRATFQTSTVVQPVWPIHALLRSKAAPPMYATPTLHALAYGQLFLHTTVYEHGSTGSQTPTTFYLPTAWAQTARTPRRRHPACGALRWGRWPWPRRGSAPLRGRIATS